MAKTKAEPEQVTIVIPSRARPQNVPTMNKLFPKAIWCVSESEAESYATERKLVHPDSLPTLTAKRHWINERISGIVFHVDDDITALWSNVGELGHRITNPDTIEGIIRNAAHLAGGFGAPIFGFNQAWDVRKYDPLDPFAFTGWVGTAVGFLGREIKHDVTLKAQSDVDICLRAMLKKRIIFIDKRFSFMCQRFTNGGGLAGVRTAQEYNDDIEKVRQRWGPWITFRKAKGTMRLNTAVTRRQRLEI
jgi:hypothetical protein